MQVKKYDFSVANKSFTEKMAEQLRKSAPSIYDVIDVEEEEAKLAKESGDADAPRQKNIVQPNTRPAAAEAPADAPTKGLKIFAAFIFSCPATLDTGWEALMYEMCILCMMRECLMKLKAS